MPKKSQDEVGRLAEPGKGSIHLGVVSALLQRSAMSLFLPKTTG
jgi:hypothetical protein